MMKKEYQVKIIKLLDEHPEVKDLLLKAYTLGHQDGVYKRPIIEEARQRGAVGR